MCTLLGRPSVLFATAVPLLGCSLLGLDDFGVTPCTSKDDCKNAETELRPSPTACGAAVCEFETGLCKWQEGHEVCNGEDDDCDGLIDEDLPAVAQPTSVAATERAVVGYAVASAAAQTFVAVVTADSPSQLLTLPAGSGESPNELRYDSQAETESYNFSEVALAADESHLVVASINTLGCALGQLHVGLSDFDRPFEVRQDKAQDAPSEEGSNIAGGVDLDGHCTGATRDSNETSGATRPAVASLGTGANEKGALLVWLGTGRSADAANALGTPVPVEALGLSVPAANPVWLNGRGKPTQLGTSTSRSAPAVLALKEAEKYLVAFPTELGIQLLSVPPDPSNQPAESLGLIATPGAHQVALALGHDEQEVGIAWRTGRGANAQVCFNVLSPANQPCVAASCLSASTSNPSPVCQPASSGNAGLTFAPQLLYRPEGFANTQPKGGWFLSWVDAASDGGGTFHVSRVREERMTSLGDWQRPLSGLAVLYPNDEESVGYASIPAAAVNKSQSETIPAWCQ